MDINSLRNIILLYNILKPSYLARKFIIILVVSSDFFLSKTLQVNLGLLNY